MADMSESLFQAIDTIVTKRLQAINFDNTDIYSITDASKAELGEYKVTDGNVVFTAYSQNTDYKEDEAVYVTIPNNDFNQQKLIIGRYTAENETPFVFTNPTSTMIDVTGNIIQGEIPEAGLTANSINTDEWPNEEEILLWQLDCQNRSYIGFERLGIKGDFKSWLKNFDCIRGHYGLKVRLYCVNNDTYSNKTYYELIRDKCMSNTEADRNWVLNTSGIIDKVTLESEDPIDDVLNYVNETLGNLFKSYDLKLDADDMIGDAFNFTAYHRQEQVFDISNLGQIIRMELYFYQEQGTFFDIFGEQIPHIDTLSGTILPRNLFTVDPYIMLGFDLNNFNGEQALLTSTDSLTYKQQDSVDSIATDSDTYNKKYIHLSWLHDSRRGIINVENDTEVDGTYFINWYKKSAGAASPDEWAGVEWEALTQDGEGNELGSHAFNYVLKIDEDSYNKPYEQIKAIIIFTSSTGNTTAIRSNIITFSNENEVVNNAAVDLGRGLTIKCLDSTNGIYYIYRQDYNLIDQGKGDEHRKLECQLYSKEFGLEGIIQEAKSITWRIPATNSMIKAIGNGDLQGFDYTGVNTVYSKSEVMQMAGVTNEEDLSDDYKALIGTTREYLYYANSLYDPTQEPEIFSINYLDASGLPSSCQTTGYLYDVENKEIVITWYGNEDLGYKINPYFDYLIEKNYLQNKTNNTITCIVNKNNRQYVGSITLRFGTAGTNGTAYTLVIEMAEYQDPVPRTIINENKHALTAGQNDEKTAFIARLYNTGGEEVDIHQSENFEKLKFVWYLGNKQDVKSYYDSHTGSITLGPYDLRNSDLPDIQPESWNIKVGNVPMVNPDRYKYGTSTYPNYIILNHNNLTMNNLLFLCLELHGWGDYVLKTVYPIPIRSNVAPFKEDEEHYRYEVDHINGPTYICYPPDGYPEFYNNPYTLYEVEYDRDTNVITDDDIQVNSVIWGIGHNIGELDEYFEVYHPHLVLEDNPTQTQINRYQKALLYLPVISGNNILKPLDFYVENQLPYGVQAVYGANEIVWTQPIWTYQNDYGSTTLNEWNGKELRIDEENGTIISRGIAAGKKDSENKFTGVVIGDWSASGDNNSSMVKNTGVYGFDKGAMAYAFKDDGTAFIGKSGSGRILFNGDESTISSQNYESYGIGLEIDLDDAIQQFKNKKPENGTEYYVTIDASRNNLEYNKNALTIGTSNTPNFRVRWDGSLFAANADIQGFIHGSTINIANGNFKVEKDGVTTIAMADIARAEIKDGTIAGSIHFTKNSYFDPNIKLSGGVYENPTLNIYYSTKYSGTTHYEWTRTYSYISGVSEYWLSGVAVVTLNRTQFEDAIANGYAIYYYKAITTTYEETDGETNANRIHFWSGSPSDPGSEIAHIGYYRGGTTGGTVTSNLGLTTFGSGHSIILDSSANIGLYTNGTIYMDGDIWIDEFNYGSSSQYKAPYVRYNSTNHHLEELEKNGDSFKTYILRYAYFA